MENLKRIALYLKSTFNSRSFILWFLLVCLGLIFSTDISSYLGNHILIGKEQLETRYFNVFYITLIIAIILKFCWYLLINYRMSNIRIFLITALSVIYYYGIRNNDTLLVLEKFHKDYRYTDVLLLVGLLTCLLAIRNFFGNILLYDTLSKKFNELLYVKNQSKQQIVSEDLPIDGSVGNELDLFADELVDVLSDLNPRQAFIIGIKAKWGYGKTSFLKRLTYKLKYNKRKDFTPIIFWFNTWQTQDDKGIVKTFFDLLKSELSFYNGNVKTTINKYVGKLLSVVYSKEVRIIKAFSDDLLGDSNTVKDYYTQVEQILEDLDRKIIVIVDDLDRLEKNEILETLRILRNAANFKNVIFICGVDKEYIISNAQIENNYLDKIFNLELDLPSTNSANIFLNLKELITKSEVIAQIDDNKKDNETSAPNETLAEKIISELSDIFYLDDNFNLADLDLLGIVTSQSETTNVPTDDLAVIPILPSLFFKSRRDIKRFFNYIITNFKILKNVSDINLKDYLLFHLLLYKYDWLRKYFEDGSLHTWMSGKIQYKFAHKNLDCFESMPTLKVLDKKIIFTILSRLFPKTDSSTGLRINQSRYFPIYLNNNIFNESFSLVELIRANEKLKLQDLITDINDNFVLNDIKAFILQEQNIISLDHYKQAIRLINENYFANISDIELLKFLVYGESKFSDEFITISNELVFTDIRSPFGTFLRDLNFYYVTIPDETNIHNFNGNNAFQEFFKEKKKTQNGEENGNVAMKYLTPNFVKEKVIRLIDTFSAQTDSLRDMNGIINAGLEKYFSYLNFSYYYEPVQKTMEQFIKKHFIIIFLQEKPEIIINQIDLIYFAKLFVDQSEKDKLSQQWEEIYKRQIFSEHDLNKRDFVKNGLNNFLAKVKTYETTAHFNEQDLLKYKEFLRLLEQRINNSGLI